jgi:hypothetical protein
MSLLVMSICVEYDDLFKHVDFRSSVNALFLSNPFCLFLFETYLMICLRQDG